MYAYLSIDVCCGRLKGEANLKENQAWFMQLNQVRQPFCQNCQILLITSVIWQINVIVWFHLCPPRIIVGPMHAECDHTVIIFKDFCCSISLSPEQNHLSHDKTEQNSPKTEQEYQAFNLFLEETIRETRRKQLNELPWSFGMKIPGQLMWWIVKWSD